jgi:hypothetical protein
MLRLVPLTSHACPDEVLHHKAHVREVEVTTKAVEGVLDAVVAVIMHGRDNIQEQL